MRIKIISLLLFSTLISAKCVFAQTTIQSSIISGGITREYRLYIPAMYNSSVPVPLVLNLHGYGSNNIEQEAYGDFRPIADTANFIIVHPNGTFDASSNRFWNTFGGSTIDDIGFLSALIDTISANYNIDENSIYSTGMSNGGFMSYDLACWLNGRIAAIASVTGTMVWPHKNSCSPFRPTPIMQIHGTADATVPYNGSMGFVPIDTLVRFWVQYNDCSFTPDITPVSDNDNTDGCTAERHLFNDGEMGSTVELYKIDDGGHSWPGASFNIDVTNMDFSASIEIWRFFRKYKLNELTSIEDHKFKAFAWSVYPNPCEDILNIETENSRLPKHITIYDMIGKKLPLLYNTGMKNNTLQINTKEWSRGVYLLSMEEGDKMYFQKIFKK